MLTLSQCIHCGFLENGVVAKQPCPGRSEHKLEPLSRQTIAQALGSTGGRPPKYATQEARIDARRERQRLYNNRRRGKEVTP